MTSIYIYVCTWYIRVKTFWEFNKCKICFKWFSIFSFQGSLYQVWGMLTPKASSDTISNCTYDKLIFWVDDSLRNSYKNLILYAIHYHPMLRIIQTLRKNGMTQHSKPVRMLLVGFPYKWVLLRECHMRVVAWGCSRLMENTRVWEPSHM